MILNLPVYIPMEHEKARGPAFSGVNSTVVSPFSGRIFSIFAPGMVKALEQDSTLLVISFKRVRTPLLRVMFEGV